MSVLLYRDPRVVRDHVLRKGQEYGDCRLLVEVQAFRREERHAVRCAFAERGVQFRTSLDEYRSEYHPRMGAVASLTLRRVNSRTETKRVRVLTTVLFGQCCMQEEPVHFAHVSDRFRESHEPYVSFFEDLCAAECFLEADGLPVELRRVICDYIQ